MIIDLSLPIRNNTHEPDSPKISYISHRQGAVNLINSAVSITLKNNLLQGLILKFLTFFAPTGLGKALKIRSPFITPDDFQDGLGLANEDMALDTHAGTHIDAPWHFGPELSGIKSRTADKIPLDWCYADGVVLDFRNKKPGEEISEKDIDNALDAIQYDLKPYDIALIMTGADKHFDQDDYFYAHPGMSAKATACLIERGVKIIGIDAWGFDRPAMTMLRDFLNTRDRSRIFPAHFVGRKLEYCHIEKLANLDKIPRPHGFKIACFPVKIENASAAWCRVVAII